MQRPVIIGNGAAALAALAAIRRAGSECPVTMISDEEGPAYSKVLTPYVVSGQMTDPSMRSMEWYARQNVRPLFGRAAVAVARNEVVLQGGLGIPFDRLLVATGASAYIPPLPGVELEGVHTLRTVADARAILSRIRTLEGRGAERRLEAVFVGGGLVCLLAVGALLRRGLSITILVSSRQLLSTMLDQQGSGLVERRMRELGVRVRTNTDAAALISNSRTGTRRRTGSAVRAVLIAGGEEVRADLVIVAKGVRSNITPVAGSGVATSRGILVDSSMRSSVDGVFAAGDVAESPDLLTPGKRRICATWFEAVHQGEIAGLMMAGRWARSPGSLRMNVMEAGGLPLASIGLSDPDEPGCEVFASPGPGRPGAWAEGGSSGSRYRKLIVRDGRLVGAVLVGDVSDAGTLASLIRRRARLSGIRTLDLHSPISYGRLVASSAYRS